ncbi:hypothetical protein BS636_10795 [Acinetobacter sp. LoGeW2-3]|uniref:hypothetical protein n=1 Tax=Acinetobacter sp. LoGeW2-3 TaxID=1808001 RepID=UPI000C05A2CD|nr:hypothetical protein [Acinetobacter sp. LoGeW2-3]ATO20111.1 hypothetical protein BS636_10795 [Acinetobacter sp. LoGeW2-3]
MFEPKQLIEGKIFIHQRQNEPLLYSRFSFPACYFECFIHAQNFSGHFIEVHAEPADQVRIIYIQKNGQNKIIAMFNQTQNIVHLHPQNLIFGFWSLKHRVLPNALQLFGFVFALLTFFFSLAAFSVGHFQLGKVMLDALMLCLMGLGLFTVGFIIPFVAPYLYWQRYHTMKLLRLLDLSPEQILKMEKLNPQSRIYHLNPQTHPVKISA